MICGYVMVEKVVIFSLGRRAVNQNNCLESEWVSVGNGG